MDRFKDKLFQRRLLMTIVGVLISGFSVGMFNFSVFGMDPFQVFAHGIWYKVGFSYGVVYMVINLCLAVVDLFLDRTKMGLATFINLFLLGYVVEFSSNLWDRLIPNPSVVVRALFLLIGVTIMCIGSALYFTSNLGVSTYDAIALTINEKTGWDFRLIRISTDLICTIIGFLLGAQVGIGTVFTAFFMGPFIEFFNRTIARPWLNMGTK